MEKPGVITVMIVDDHPVVRQGLAAIIGTQPDMRVVGQVGTGADALRVFESEQPDVTLMDLQLPDISGIEVAARLHAQKAQARVVMFTSYAREDEIQQALKAGALSYIRKGSEPTELLTAIRTVHAGRRHVPAEIGRHLAEHTTHSDLTPREHEVLQKMFEGKSNKEIAASLQLSDQTVGVHVKRILSKLGVNSRTEAVTLGLRRGLLHID
jgi:DNA-binding NarL/FixJ family response regulator